MRIVDLVYDSYEKISDPSEILARQVNTLSFIPFIAEKADYHVIRHLNYSGKLEKEGSSYHFFKRENSRWSIPLQTHQFIKELCPDIIFIQGFIYPLQVLALKTLMGKKPAIIMQHHGETPVRSARRYFQNLADHITDAYLFSSSDNAKPWIDSYVIKNREKIKVIPAASINLKRKNKQDCRQALGLGSELFFLWVGRLEKNKDPLTVLKAYSKFLQDKPGSKFFMIYQSAPLYQEIKSFIKENNLSDFIELVGEVRHDDLEQWYSACDYYVSASHAEACGYTLIEAMHCGCIPIATDIPSFRELSVNGRYAHLYSPGNADELAVEMNNLTQEDQSRYSEEIQAYAIANLSPKNTADKLYDICRNVLAKK